MCLRITPEIFADAIADIGEPNRVELMQRPELAGRVPPFRRHGGEAVDFVLVDGGLCGIGHGSLPPVSPPEVGRSGSEVKGRTRSMAVALFTIPQGYMSGDSSNCC